MIVYTESNFILEMARQQEDAAACEEILRLAEAQATQLAVPAFAICEPFSTLTYYGLERARFVEQMQREFRELARLQPHRSLASMLQPLGQTLLAIEKTEMDSLQTQIRRILKIATIIQFEAAIFEEAQTIQIKLDVSIQDSIVYASVLADLRLRPPDVPKCFVSRNAKDFDDPAIDAELKNFGCRYIARFSDALSYIRSAPK